MNGALAIILFRKSDKPKPVNLEPFSWREWAESQAVYIVLFVLFAVLGFAAADLAFLAICFGVGNLLMVAFRSWDRHALRRHGATSRP